MAAGHIAESPVTHAPQTTIVRLVEQPPIVAHAGAQRPAQILPGALLVIELYPVLTLAAMG